MDTQQPDILPWHRESWQAINRQLQQQRLSHAYLLQGESGIGKRQFAEALAALLLCRQPAAALPCGTCPDCRMLQSGAHPDLLRVSPTDNSLQIRIEQIRELAGFISMTSHSSARKLVILHPAEALNANSANALLKTLEEPAGNAVLLLVTDLPGRLLPTLRSRCLKVPLVRPGRDVALDWLASQVQWPDPAALLDAAQGKPLLAKNLADSGDMEQRNSILNGLVALSAGKASAHQFVAASRNLETSAVVGCLLWASTILIRYMVTHDDTLLGSTQARTIAESLLPDETAARGRLMSELLDFEAAVVEAGRQLQSTTNPNPALILQTLVWQWCALHRRR